MMKKLRGIGVSPGVVIPTGKFSGTKTRPEVKKENAGHEE